MHDGKTRDTSLSAILHEFSYSRKKGDREEEHARKRVLETFRKCNETGRRNKKARKPCKSETIERDGDNNCCFGLNVADGSPKVNVIIKINTFKLPEIIQNLQTRKYVFVCWVAAISFRDKNTQKMQLCAHNQKRGWGGVKRIEGVDGLYYVMHPLLLALS